MNIFLVGHMIDNVRERLPHNYRIKWIADFHGVVPELQVTLTSDDPMAEVITKRRLASEAGLLRLASWFDAGNVTVTHHYTRAYTVQRARALKDDLDVSVIVSRHGLLLIDDVSLGEASKLLPKIERPVAYSDTLPTLPEKLSRIVDLGAFHLDTA
ncbi:hypothetical protein NPJ88_000100 [Halomonas elongata]|uniref:hypothetical protein n=1 Tax=Halomonas elongata TaxID=2746 RepID=UPI00255AD0AE|nr:hypothetical protein [Halomonas elongata]MDL4860723.1 hypothetical protein [Halomonas elongata]